MKEEICENCLHYLQHYVKREQLYTAAYCGHCKYPRVKTRMPDTAACPHYKEQSDKTDCPL